MVKNTKRMLAFLIVFLFAFADVCFATPPAISYLCIIIEGGSPENITISLAGDSGDRFKSHKKLWETCFVYDGWFSYHNEDWEIAVKIGDESFTFLLSTEEIRENDNTLTLNIKNRSLTAGKSLSRSVLLISIRMLVILAMQMLLFFILGCKVNYKRNIAIFLTVNFVCWLIINLIANQLSIYSSNQAMFWIDFNLAGLFAVSTIIVLVLMPLLIKGEDVLKRFSLGFFSHFAGCILMRLMIGFLPL